MGNARAHTHRAERVSAAFPCGGIHHTHHIHHMPTAWIADARMALENAPPRKNLRPPESATTSRCPAPE
jgi:hypothetical protein